MKDGKIIITEMNGKQIAMLTDGRNIRRIHCSSAGSISVGTVVVGSVVRYLPSIHAAFIDIGGKAEYYLPVPESDREPLHLCGREYNGRLNSGELVLAQVATEPSGQKQPGLSGQISLQGVYCVVNSDAEGLAVSHKLSRRIQHEWNENKKLRSLAEKYQIIIRTNSVSDTEETDLTEEEVLRTENEASDLCEKLDDIFLRYKHLVKGSRLYVPQSEINSFISNIPFGAYSEIVTDIPDIYPQIIKLSDEDVISSEKNIRLYSDKDYPLSAAYSLNNAIHALLEKKVWLKSGSFLYIEQTEALCAIDVNTGKNISGKNKEETVFKTNMEAADAIAVQLTARNISGMILVDFINMQEQSHIDALMKHMEELLVNDCVEAKCVDYTRLGLMEITREKKYKRFSEQWLVY
jgi:ribonuclease G